MIITYRCNVLYGIPFHTPEKRLLRPKDIDFVEQMKKVSQMKVNSAGIDFYIRNDSPQLKEVERLLIENDHPGIDDCTIEYPPEAIRRARYFVAHVTWRNGYPYPESSYLEQSFENPNGNFIKCDCRIIQSAPLSIQRIPDWKKRNFMGVFWLHDSLFCSQKVKQLFEENHITGIEFLPVNHKKTGFIEGTYQVKILLQTKIDPKYRRNEYCEQQICKTCGSSYVYTSPDYLMKYDIDNFDVTADIFYSNGPFNHRKIIISRKVYELMKRYELDHGLRLDVVFLHDMFDLICGVPSLDSYELSRNGHSKSTECKIEDEYYIHIYPGKEKKIPKEIIRHIPVFIPEADRN